MGILEEAAGLVEGARREAYGHPLDNFGMTAGMLTYLLQDLLKPGAEIRPEHVGLIMVVVKLAREMSCHGRDNLVDGAGYLGTVDLVYQERERRARPGRAEREDDAGASAAVDTRRTCRCTASKPKGSASLRGGQLDGKEAQAPSLHGGSSEGYARSVTATNGTSTIWWPEWCREEG